MTALGETSVGALAHCVGVLAIRGDWRWRQSGSRDGAGHGRGRRQKRIRRDALAFCGQGMDAATVQALLLACMEVGVTGNMKKRPLLRARNVETTPSSACLSSVFLADGYEPSAAVTPSER